MKCPLDDSCSRVRCDAVKLVEWQAENNPDEHKLQRLASRVASFKCKK